MSKPHIIIFNPDQWRGDVMGHLGNGAAVTPRLDRFVAQDAVSFRWAFCQNPVCTPSRCSFMTGWYPHVRGHRTMFHMLHQEHGETNLLGELKKDGYYVWWGGKNDLVPGGKGFEDFCNHKFQASAEYYKRWNVTSRPNLHAADEWRGDPAGDNYYSFYAGKLDTGEDDIYCDGDWACVLGAIDFIRNYDGEQPLCIYLPIGYPHPPYGVEEPYYSMIDREKIPPRFPTPDWSNKAIMLEGIASRQRLQNWTENRWHELQATYYGMCARVDDQFGRVVDALKEKSMYDDSAVFFFSDHGDFTGDYGLVEKNQNTFEDNITRVPFIIKPPKAKQCNPRVSDALVELIDFAATVYDVAGIDPGYDHFGKSLLPLIAGKTDQHRDAVFCEGGRRRGERQAMEIESTSSTNPEGLYFPRVGLQTSDERPWHGKATMCRTSQYKYVKRMYERDEFYDLEADPGELVNLIDDENYRGQILEHKERMLQWYQETCDVVPQTPDNR